MKVIAYDINEIWSADLAYVDKLAKYNNGVKYLLVSVEVLSRYLRVEPLKSKDAAVTKRAFKRMIKNKRPKKLWTDRVKSSRECSNHFVMIKVLRYITQKVKQNQLLPKETYDPSKT